ncbi:MAG: hypothetical protein KC496_00550 [Anaerolineae bacterium]|nr:hypothetical protein [Anaerolineae bacterium]
MQTATTSQAIVIPAIPQTLYPTLNNTREVVELAESKLPITDANELYALLMIYHNTLIAQMGKGKH